MNIPYVFKKCTKCGEIKLATNKYFSKQKRGKYGLTAKCKICNNEYSKKWNENNKEHRKEYGKKWNENNKEYKKEYAKKWNENNKEYKKEYDKEYYENNKEYKKECSKKWRENNKEHTKEYKKEYRESEQGQVVNFNAQCRRRMREQNQGNGITKDQWRECMLYFDFRDAYTGEVLTKENRSLDHIIPVSKDGDNEIWNIVPMERSLNSSKKDKDLLEWYKQQDFYSEERLQKIYEWQEYAFNKYGK